MNTMDDLFTTIGDLERETEMKLNSLNNLCTHKSNSFQKNIITQTCDDIEVLLRRLSELVEVLSSEIPPSETNPVLLYKRDNHRYILTTYKSDFKKLYRNYQEQTEREELMTKIDKEFTFRKTPSDHVVKENDFLDSFRLVDDQLAVASATKDKLISQRQLLAGVQRNVRNISVRLSVVQRLLGKVTFHKLQNAIILALIMFICLFIINIKFYME